MNASKATQLVQVLAYDDAQARKEGILRLCKGWGVLPVQHFVRINQSSYHKMRYDFRLTITKLAQYIMDNDNGTIDT